MHCAVKYRGISLASPRLESKDHVIKGRGGEAEVWGLVEVDYISTQRPGGRLFSSGPSFIFYIILKKRTTKYIVCVE